MKKVIVHRRHFNHPWIFSNEVVRAEDISPGEVVKIEERHKTIGVGFYNPHSLIAVRQYSEVEQDFDKNFIRKKLIDAGEIRKHMGKSYRFVYSESDSLPGLIIDRYEDYFVVQINSLGMEQQKEKLFKILVEDYGPKGIYEKSEENLRKLEGLEPVSNVIYGTVPEIIEIEQDGLRFLVDVINGQKTGFFLDQRENRLKARESAKGEILDCFCYSGAFSLYAVKKGNILGIDSSASAIDLAQKNARLNNLECSFECRDVFETLREFARNRRSFDTIFLDPPSFTKSKKTKNQAFKGYKEINLAAMQLLSDGGLLFTSSCSYHLSMQEFIEVLQDAAADAGRKFVIIHQGRQSGDHPILLNFQESNYLKAIFAVEIRS